jgi:hypothetical protein
LRGERLPLTGADCFLRAFDTETLRWNGASHLSQLVLRLGPGFELDRFGRVLADVVEANPILRAPIRRDLGLGRPCYRLDRARRTASPPVEIHEADAPALPELFRRRLNEARSARRGELLRVDVVRHGQGRVGTDLALTWLHMLFDGHGSERFVAFLEACGTGACRPGDVPDADRPGAAPEIRLPESLRERGAMATAWQHWMAGLGASSVRSPAGPLRRARQDLSYDLFSFSAEETARISERASALAGFLTPMLFYLAAAIRAHHVVMCKRGAEPESYVVPLPVNLRPKGAAGGIFRTRVSMIWFQVASKIVGDLPALLDQLKEQRRRSIREHQIENGVAAMDFARFAPTRVYTRMARRALRGELCSFFFAYTDQFCLGLDRFFGASVENGFHAPAVPPSPGSGLVLSLRDGRLNYTHVRQRNALDEAELELLRGQLARDLTGAG